MTEYRKKYYKYEEKKQSKTLESQRGNRLRRNDKAYKEKWMEMQWKVVMAWTPYDQKREANKWRGGLMHSGAWWDLSGVELLEMGTFGNRNDWNSQTPLPIRASWARFPETCWLLLPQDKAYARKIRIEIISNCF